MTSFLSCVTCQANSSLGGSDAVGWSIFFLLIVILMVMATVVFFMVRMAMRAKKFAMEEEAALLSQD
jgi:hypothetical protein